MFAIKKINGNQVNEDMVFFMFNFLGIFFRA